MSLADLYRASEPEKFSAQNEEARFTLIDNAKKLVAELEETRKKLLELGIKLHITNQSYGVSDEITTSFSMHVEDFFFIRY